MYPLPSLLIIDNIKKNLILFETFKEKLKVNVIKATSGFYELGKTKGVDYVISIIDVKMPIMDRFELARSVNLNIPIIE
jgi:CheY-like chemotaxis protein